MYANATFEAVKAVGIFADRYIVPILGGLLHHTERERKLIALHYRMVAFLASLRRLDDRRHVQSIAAAARPVFEVALDTVLLSRDGTTESVDRMNADGGSDTRS
jgi:hypothetical protein